MVQVINKDNQIDCIAVEDPILVGSNDKTSDLVHVVIKDNYLVMDETSLKVLSECIAEYFKNK